MHWLVVRFRGERLPPTAGRSLSKDSALLLQRGRHACLCPRPAAPPSPWGPSLMQAPRPGGARPSGADPTGGGVRRKATCSPSTGLLAWAGHCPHAFRGTANGRRGNEGHPGPGPSEDERHSRASEDPVEDCVPSHNTLRKTQPLPPCGARRERLPDRQTADRKAERAGGGHGRRRETLGSETRRAAPASCCPAHCRPRRHKSPGATTRKPHLAEALAAPLRPALCPSRPVTG